MASSANPAHTRSSCPARIERRSERINAKASDGSVLLIDFFIYRRKGGEVAVEGNVANVLEPFIHLL